MLVLALSLAAPMPAISLSAGAVRANTAPGLPAQASVGVAGEAPPAPIPTTTLAAPVSATPEPAASSAALPGAQPPPAPPSLASSTPTSDVTTASPGTISQDTPAGLSPSLPSGTAPTTAPTTSSEPSLSPPPDPLRGFNRLSYAISQPIDHLLLRPIALAYARVVPAPLRDGIRNALANLFAPVVFVNDVLQLRPRRALRTAARMVVNTALGIGGLFDVAKRPSFKLPGHPNGFADTLGYYGIGPGPYLYLPVLGPTSFRDAAGGVADIFTEPRLLGKLAHPTRHQSIWRASIHFGTIGTAMRVTGGIDARARAEPALAALKAQSVDPYASLRSSYLQDRAGEIAMLKAKDGAPPAQAGSLADPLADPLIDPAPTPPTPAPPTLTPAPAP